MKTNQLNISRRGTKGRSVQSMILELSGKNRDKPRWFLTPVGVSARATVVTSDADAMVINPRLVTQRLFFVASTCRNPIFALSDVAVGLGQI